jgi:hypothetical protein
MIIIENFRVQEEEKSFSLQHKMHTFDKNACPDELLSLMILTTIIIS